MRDEEIKKMSPKELRNKLSNKNQDYIFRLEKFLTEDQNYTMDQVEPAIDQILPEIIVAQRKGIPASNLYQKAPREKAFCSCAFFNFSCCALPTIEFLAASVFLLLF